MNYKIYASNGDRLTMDIDQIVQDGQGTRLLDVDGKTIAVFSPGEVVRVFPEEALEEAEIIIPEV